MSAIAHALNDIALSNGVDAALEAAQRTYGLVLSTYNAALRDVFVLPRVRECGNWQGMDNIIWARPELIGPVWGMYGVDNFTSLDVNKLNNYYIEYGGVYAGWQLIIENCGYDHTAFIGGTPIDVSIDTYCRLDYDFITNSSFPVTMDTIEFYFTTPFQTSAFKTYIQSLKDARRLFVIFKDNLRSKDASIVAAARSLVVHDNDFLTLFNAVLRQEELV